MSRFLRDFWDFAMRERYNVLRISHWRAGKIRTADIVRAHPSQHVYSLAKVLTLTAIGLLADEGKLSVSDRALPLLSGSSVDAQCMEIQDMGQSEGAQGALYHPSRAADESTDQSLSRWKQVCVDHLLAHRAGLPEGFLDVDQMDWRQWGTADFLQYTLQSPLIREPGKERIYSDGAYYLLGRIAEQAAGLPLLQYLRERLLDPLGVRDAAWSTCPMGHAMGATGLYIRTEDLCKIGALYYQGGMYDGRQYLSEEWVRTVLEKEWEFTKLHPNGAWGKGGMMGQMLLVVPSEGRVVAWQAYDRKGNERLVRFGAEYGADC